MQEGGNCKSEKVMKTRKMRHVEISKENKAAGKEEGATTRKEEKVWLRQKKEKELR